MSTLLAFLQNELLSLSNEAKKKHPDIKEASERLLLLLRTLKDKPQTGADPIAQELYKTEEGCKPFVLACDTKNQKLIPIALGCIQKLVSHKAVPESFLLTILKTLGDLASSNMDNQLKILQTLIPLLGNYQVHGNALAQSMTLCFKLQECKSPIVSNTAAATCRQMFISVFDKLKNESENSDNLSDAVALFDDLCLAASGEAMKMLNTVVLPRLFTLELLFDVVTQSHQVFVQHEKLLEIQRKVCGVLTRAFSEKLDFSTTLRLTRLMLVIIKKYCETLKPETEIFFNLICKTLDSSSSEPPLFWPRTVFCEFLKELYSDSTVARTLCKQFDMHDGSINVITETFKTLGKVVTQEKQKHQIHLEQFSEKDCLVKMPLIEQLDKVEPPLVPDLYVLYTALITMTQVVDGLALQVLQLFPPGQAYSTPSESSQVLVDLSNALCSSLLNALITLFEANVDSDIFNLLLSCLEKQAIVLGQLGLKSSRDQYLNALCSLCLPGGLVESSPKTATVIASSNTKLLQERHCTSIKALLNISHNLVQVLDLQTWMTILGTLEQAEILISTGKTEKSQMSDKNPKISTLDNFFVNLLTSIKKFMDSTVNFNILELDTLVRALLVCALDSATVNSAIIVSTKEKTEEKIFGLTKLQLVLSCNYARIIQENIQLWSFVADQLVMMSHMLNMSTNFKPQIFSILNELISTAFTLEKSVLFKFESELLEPLSKLLLVVPIPDMNQDYRDQVLESVWFFDVAKCALDTLTRVLQSSGQYICKEWNSIFKILEAVLVIAEKLKDEETQFATPRATVIVRSAFQPVQLICMDFLSLLSAAEFQLLVTCLGQFGQQKGDLNVSLTAIGLLWSVSDHLLSREGMATVWIQILSAFATLCTDLRPEVRNSANQTLFRCIKLNGHKLLLDSWTECVGIMLHLFDRISVAATSQSVAVTDSKLMVHHSRNSAQKQWDETKILCLNGAFGVFIEYLETLIGLENWMAAIESLFNYTRACIIDASPELATAAIKQMKLFIKIPTEKELPLKDLQMYLWKVWLDIGFSLVYREQPDAPLRPIQVGSGVLSEFPAVSVIAGPLPLDVLHSFVLLFPDLYSVIQTEFNSKLHVQLNTVLLWILLYHTIPNNTGENKYKMEVGDSENMTGLQATCFDLLSLPFKETEEADPLKQIHSFAALAKLLEYPFIENKTNCKAFTFNALTLKTAQQLPVFVTGISKDPLFYSDSFNLVLNSFKCVVVQKYDKPLWKPVFDSFIGIISQCLNGSDSEINVELIFEILQLLFVNNRIPSNLSEDEKILDEQVHVQLLDRVTKEIVPNLKNPPWEKLVSIFVELCSFIGIDGWIREKFTLAAMSSAFSLGRSSNLMLTKVAIPQLIQAAKSDFSNFCNEKRIHGRVPLNRLLYKQIKAWLMHLKDWELNGTFSVENTNGNTSVTIVSESVASGKRAHLLSLYGDFMNLLNEITANYALQTVIQEEEEILKLIHECLGLIGQELKLTFAAE